MTVAPGRPASVAVGGPSATRSDVRRILLATDFFYPTIGGAERQVQLLAAALATRGHDVSVATVRQRRQREFDRVDGVDVHRLSALSTHIPGASADPDRKFLPPVPDPRLAAGLRGLVDRLGGVDLVHASGWIAYSCAVAAQASATPVVLSVRDYGYSCAVRSLLHLGREICAGPGPGKCLHCAGRTYGAARGLITVVGLGSGRMLLRRRVAAIHVVSRYVESVVRRDLLGGDADWNPVVERIDDVVPRAYEHEPLSTADRAMLDRLPSVPFILFVGQLSLHKGIGVLARAYRQLRAQRHGDVPPLVMVGPRVPGVEVPRGDGVIVIESVPHPVVMAAWERSLFGVAPSVWPDPLPGVVREAMTLGRPVVASAVGGNLDMVENGVNGLLTPPGDASALAAAMASVLDDQKRAAEMGAAAFASVSDLTAPAIAARFENLYRAALPRERGAGDRPIGPRP